MEKKKGIRRARLTASSKTRFHVKHLFAMSFLCEQEKEQGKPSCSTQLLRLRACTRMCAHVSTPIHLDLRTEEVLGTMLSLLLRRILSNVERGC